MRLSFLGDLSVVSAAHAVAGLLAFAYTVVVSRRLGVADYGLFQAAMALYSMLTAFVAPLGWATMHSVAVSDDASRPLVVGRLLRVALLVSGICTGVLTCLSPWLASLLHSTVFPIVWVAVLVTVAAMLAVFYGAIQGRNAYTLYSAAKVAEALAVLVVGSALVMLGTGASGAVLGYLLGMLSLVLFFSVRRQLYSLGKGAPNVWAEMRTFVDILLVHGTILFANDFPVLLVRSRLSTHESGLYGSLYNLRQVVLPFCFALSAPLYSRTVAASSGRSALIQVLAVVSGLGGVFLVIGVFAPRLPFLLIYGPAFAEASRYVVAYGIVLSLLMLSVVTMFYQVARKRIVRTHLLVPVVVLVVASTLPHPSILRLIWSQAVAWACYLVVTLVASGVSGFFRRRAMILPGVEAETLGRRKAGG